MVYRRQTADSRKQAARHSPPSIWLVNEDITCLLLLFGSHAHLTLGDHEAFAEPSPRVRCVLRVVAMDVSARNPSCTNCWTHWCCTRSRNACKLQLMLWRARMRSCAEQSKCAATAFGSGAVSMRLQQRHVESTGCHPCLPLPMPKQEHQLEPPQAAKRSRGL